MKFEKISLDKFENSEISSTAQSGVVGGAFFTRGGHWDFNGVTETFDSDTQHDNGALSWETDDFIICDDVDN